MLKIQEEICFTLTYTLKLPDKVKYFKYYTDKSEFIRTFRSMFVMTAVKKLDQNLAECVAEEEL